MSIKSTLAGIVERHDSAADEPDAIDRRLAPYTVTSTSIRIPRQRQGRSATSSEPASTD